MAKGRYIFQCAEDAHREITSLFDFVQPTVIALWNLRWQVQGFLKQVPQATSEDLANRFALGSGIRGGALKRACIDIPWQRQQSEFAEFVLSSSIAAFEEYTGRLAELGVPERRRRGISKALQFPPSSAGTAADGYPFGLAALSRPSSALQGVFQAACIGHKRYAVGNLNALLVCYRFFKTMRNMIAHNGGRADQETVDAYNRFVPVAAGAALGLPEVPKHSPVVLGQPIELELRGVIGMSDVILRIIRTYDAQLCATALAESQIAARLKPVPPKQRFAKKGDVERRVASLVYGSGLPAPLITARFIEFLKKHHIIPSFW